LSNFCIRKAAHGTQNTSFVSGKNLVWSDITHYRKRTADKQQCLRVGLEDAGYLAEDTIIARTIFIPHSPLNSYGVSGKNPLSFKAPGKTLGGIKTSPAVFKLFLGFAQGKREIQRLFFGQSMSRNTYCLLYCHDAYNIPYTEWLCKEKRMHREITAVRGVEETWRF
jgi:hypothetical protein